MSSRNWPNIEEHLESATQKVRLCLELNEKSVSNAVHTYIGYKVGQLAQRKKYDGETREAVQRHLRSNTHDTFLWAALVCQDLKDVPRRKALDRLNAFPPGLNPLYNRMMQRICDSDEADLCKRILALVSVVFRPLTLLELAALIESEDFTDDLESLRDIIGDCGLFLTIREDAFYFVHQSAKDFLLKEAQICPLGEEEVHDIIFSRSLEIMKTLHRDMYGLGAPGCSIDDVERPDPDPLAATGYSCVYWIDHLVASSKRADHNSTI